ncbi:hypothetical protein GIB67_015381 [Kingdonia uniflora]|uniref:Lon proteolytic domain-containing protein n=1 Tax=Kingdonia uniflora TaxID=39325 RepID=A0A7J7KYW9_9MAGN|nr:hypothetical protein GIB67_015381 [Kingdonia uniflora]
MGKAKNATKDTGTWGKLPRIQDKECSPLQEESNNPKRYYQPQRSMNQLTSPNFCTGHNDHRNNFREHYSYDEALNGNVPPFERGRGRDRGPNPPHNMNQGHHMGSPSRNQRYHNRAPRYNDDYGDEIDFGRNRHQGRNEVADVVELGKRAETKFKTTPPMAVPTSFIFSSSDTLSRSGSGVQCFRCGKIGHMHRDYPNAKKHVALLTEKFRGHVTDIVQQMWDENDVEILITFPEEAIALTEHNSYLNVPFDLSKVIFVATANRLQPIPPPLLDRMEVIELPGYTPEEKIRIAMRHLIPRVLDQHGLSSDFLQIPEAMVKLVVQRYTREAGVRNLERNLAALARAAAVRVAEQENTVPLSKDIHQISTSLLNTRLADGGEVEMEVIPMDVNNHEISNAIRSASALVVDESMLEKVLGPPRFDDNEAAERVTTPGITVGLVWTTFGGEVQFVEATSTMGKGDLHLTGQLGDVIKESAQIALTWVRARAMDLKLVATEEINLLEKRDVHIHFPAGAVPKDGPSAGVTLVTSLVSLFSLKRVRADTAMTGEMTLRGLVLPVGGIKDKILAAHRYGIKRVILPERNLKDLVEVPSTVLASLEILLAKTMEDVLEQAFEGGCPWRQQAKL